MPAYTIGLDYGTNSVRAVLVDIETGKEVATSVYDYRHGEAGVLLDPRDPDQARQHPQDYVDGASAVIRGILDAASALSGFMPGEVLGIGVDTTGSTPIPVDENGKPLALTPEFEDYPAAMAVLWKDHTGHAEAQEITALAAKLRPHYLKKCGGTYSAEWFWAKILHNLRATPDVFARIYTWVEHADWLPALLCGATHPDSVKRGICAAGHKAMFNPAWGGYPDEAFLAELDPGLARIRRTLPERAYRVGDAAGLLSEEWADRTGLLAGIPVSVGAFDAHLGAVGSGITPGALVKIIGTSTCDMMVSPMLDSKAGLVCGLCDESSDSLCAGEAGFPSKTLSNTRRAATVSLY